LFQWFRTKEEESRQRWRRAGLSESQIKATDKFVNRSALVTYYLIVLGGLVATYKTGMWIVRKVADEDVKVTKGAV
jgi:hypothetical protein